jgi:hypothetical protein
VKKLLALLALSGCASPQTVIEIQRDPATGVVTGRIDRSWLGGECVVTGHYKSTDGTVVEFMWASDVDLSAALRDRADAREQLKAAAEVIANAVVKP